MGTDAVTGRRLGGRYLIGARLGGGGMAIVYRAVDERLHRDVAVKVLDAMRGADEEQRARFEIEARAAASITHPNVVAVHDVGIDGDPPNTVPYIVMECLPGRTLADEVRAGPLPAAPRLPCSTTSSPRSTPPMRRVCCTATSSPGTCCSTKADG